MFHLYVEKKKNGFEVYNFFLFATSKLFYLDFSSNFLQTEHGLKVSIFLNVKFSNNG